MYKSFTSKAIFSMEWQVKKSSEIEVSWVKNILLSMLVQNVMLFGQKQPPPRPPFNY